MYDRPDLDLLRPDIASGILVGVPDHVAGADVTRLPLATSSVDAALALYTLYHVPDIPQAVQELSRVVARDGMVSVSTNSGRDKADSTTCGSGLPATPWASDAALSASRSAPAAPWRRPRPSWARSSAAWRRSSCPAPSWSAIPSRSSLTWPPTGRGQTSTKCLEAAIERARAILLDHIAQHGVFESTCLGGILVCRR
ncbi:class I SAM-dependent methyltransferase [Streptomyces mirabilis]|uniref:class I SAM-dependent methyltransferase n=1 Tax=Streptomyces mirabilis TaxID=68239 RepID=UPI0036AF40BC